MLNLTVKDGKTFAPLSELSEWDKNPRVVGPVAFSRLKEQIRKLGEYKPLIVTGEGTVLGGNTRLKAYRELGYTEAWVSVVDTTDKNKILEYNLSDNDNVGFYNESELANMTSEYDIDWDLYAADFQEPLIIGNLMGNGDQPDQGKSGIFGGKEVECPECGHKFTPPKSASN